MPTIGGTVIRNANRVPDREALVSGVRRWTWRELDAEIARVAGRLHEFGLAKGDRFALLSSNSPEFVIASHAASRLGAIVVPINTRLAPPELAHIISDSGSSLLAFGSQETALAESVRSREPSMCELPTLVALGTSAKHPNLFEETSAEPIREDHAVESDNAFILYTSGTTGNPKGALFDHHRAVWAAMAQIVSLGLRDGDRYLHLTPMYHSGGTTFMNVTTLLGGTHLLIPAFDPESVLDMIEQEKATWLFGVPTMYQFLLKLPDLARRDLNSWRIGVFGAAPMPASAVSDLLAALPHVDFFQQCGQTEAGPTGIYSTMPQVLARPDSSGHIAQPFMEARVVDRSGIDTPPGEVGELLFRGEAVMKEYWNRPEATAETIRDSWLHTGDLMHVTADGAMRLVDRLKDVIISGGRNIYSAEVEQAIAQHPSVADVAVIGRPHPEWGATVIAVVNLHSGAMFSLDSLREHCRPLIADYKIPRDLVLGAVPRNATGKVQKHLLRTDTST